MVIFDLIERWRHLGERQAGQQQALVPGRHPVIGAGTGRKAPG
jgi:hypothetical protein